MATRASARSPRSRPSRPLAFILVLVAALSGFVWFKHWTPRQGLDLVGGTSVILTPKGGTPSRGSLNSAVDIIRRRVNATGVSSAEVVTEGSNVRVALPSVGREDALKIVGTTAELTFRPVLNALGPGPATPQSATPTPSASAKVKKSPKPTASASAKKRAMSNALLAQAPSPTPTATATPKPSGSATPAPSAPAVAEGSVDETLATADCTDPKVREELSDKYGDPKMDSQPIVSCDAEGQAKYKLGPAEMTGKDIKKADATIDTSTASSHQGEWIVQLTLKSATKWGDLTEKYKGQQIAIVLDGVTQSAPQVQDKIPNGVATISGSFTQRSAKTLANVLKYGSLPVQFEKSQTQTISPTLGKRSLHGGLVAGIIGLLLVLIYALLYYRGLGIVTAMGLIVFGLLNFTLVVILGHTIGFTLTLAGIAGLIVSVGISADSYVVFYERLKDEVREGKSLRQSVDRGFQRAFRTILAADFVSFLAAATLYLLSIGEVRGFAFTLGLATLLDVTVAWFFTRPIVMLLTRTRLFTEGRFVGITAAAPLKEA